MLCLLDLKRSAYGGYYSGYTTTRPGATTPRTTTTSRIRPTRATTTTTPSTTRSYPKYVYYYNPYKRVYWGRYDLEAKGYSLLEEKDRKEKLADIPESAFPKPGPMPADPESTDGSKIPAPPQPPPLQQGRPVTSGRFISLSRNSSA